MSRKQEKVKNQIVHNSKCRLFEIEGGSEFSGLHGLDFPIWLMDLILDLYHLIWKVWFVQFDMFGLVDLD